MLSPEFQTTKARCLYLFHLSLPFSIMQKFLAYFIITSYVTAESERAMKNIFQIVTNLCKTMTMSPAEKLGLPKDFPMNVCVYIKRESNPRLEGKEPAIAAFFENTHFLNAAYKGNDTWLISDLEIEPHEMGTDIVDQCEPWLLSTRQMLNVFQNKLSEHPSQPIQPYWTGQHISVAHNKIQEMLLKPTEQAPAPIAIGFF